MTSWRPFSSHTTVLPEDEAVARMWATLGFHARAVMSVRWRDLLAEGAYGFVRFLVSQMKIWRRRGRHLAGGRTGRAEKTGKDRSATMTSGTLPVIPGSTPHGPSSNRGSPVFTLICASHTHLCICRARREETGLQGIPGQTTDCALVPVRLEDRGAVWGRQCAVRGASAVACEL